MTKRKNNKRKIVIIGIIIFLFVMSATAIMITKKDLVKNNKKEEITEERKENDQENKNVQEDNTELNTNNDDEEKEENNDSRKKATKEDDKNQIKDSNSSKPNSNTVDNTVTNNKTNTSKPNASKPNNNGSEKNPNNGSNNTKDENKSEAKPELPPVEEDKNNTKRKNMESTYGIKIAYGDEIGNYRPRGIAPVRLTDSNEIKNYLDRLNIELAKYPKGFFNDFNKRGMPLTIYLIKSANGAFSGFTDYQFMNDIKLTLATDYSFEYTVHHEMMHYIDCYLDIVMYPNNPYSEYEMLNPSGFVYGNASSNQIYNMGSNQRGAYFISSYAATHVKEDRAEVFKFMTARAYKPIGCFEPNEIIRKKAEVISKQIKTYFPSVSGTAHWDRFIS